MERVTRRRAMLWAGAAALAPLLPGAVQAEERRATPRLTEGPFYPRELPADADGDLTRVAGRKAPAEGTPLALGGRVLDRSGQPRAGARVEIWQCDARGHYHHIGGSKEGQDPGFQGFGAVTTDAQGRYAFRTIRPVPYSGRTPHIHIAVLEGGRRRLTSQVFIAGDPDNERDGLYRALGRDAALVTMRVSGGPNELSAAFDIVLQ